MLNEDEQRKRNDQVEHLRNNRTKQHAYMIRMSDQTYECLKKMAHGGPMSDVVNRGLEIEWKYFQTLEKLKKEKPQLNTIEDIERWRVEQFSTSPELLSAYASPTAILAYKDELSKSREAQDDLADKLDTIAYEIRTIGQNINQIARQANAGVDVPRDALKRMTSAVLEVKNQVQKVVEGGD